MLALLIFDETRADNTKKYFKVLSCIIYTIISNYVCIDYLACESKKICKLLVGIVGCFKHRNKTYENILGIVIPDL